MKKTLREHRTKIIGKRKRKCSLTGSGAAVSQKYSDKNGLGAETKWPTGLFLAVLDVNSVVLTLTNINSVAMREVYCIVYSFCRYRLLLCCDDGQ